MIEDAPILKISGKRYDFYFVDFQNNGGKEPSTLTVGYVLPNSATTIDLASIDSEHMPIGADSDELVEVKVYKSASSDPSFVFRGYAVSSSIDKSPEKNILEVKYIDESNILDKTYVGLKGKYGPGFESVTWGNFDNVILVGEQVDPCADIEDTVDRCSPCTGKDGNPNKQRIDCQDNLKYEIRDVVYKFPELLAAIGNLGKKTKIKIEDLPENKINELYYARYTGTIREVLNNWCSDFGLAFYWDYDYGLRFVDLKSGINIQDSEVRNLPLRILSYKDRVSIDENASSKTIAYFGENGGEDTYDCNSSSLKSVTLKPLILRDLVTDNKGNVDKDILKNYKTLDNFLTCCALASYSTTLRDLYVLYYIYDLKDPDDLLAYVVKKNQEGDSEDEPEKILHLFGDMKVKHVLHRDAAQPYLRSGYDFFLDKFPAESKKSEKEKGIYFAVVERSEELYKKTLEIEASLGKSFIGQYWYRFYSTMNRSVSPQVISPGDGAATYHKRGDEMIFDFLNIVPTDKSYLREFIKEDKEANDLTGKSADNFIMMKRAAAWVPEQNSEKVSAFLEILENYSSKTFGNEMLLNLYEENDILISFYENKALSVEDSVLNLTINKTQADATNKNPVDKKKTSEVYKTGNGIYPYGLRSSACESYEIFVQTKNIGMKIEIYLPSQSFDSNVKGSQGGRYTQGSTEGGYQDPRTVTHGGYRVLVEESSSFNALVKSLKKEMVYGVGNKNSNSVKLNVNFRNATRSLLKLINENVSIKNGQYICDYSEEAIKELVEKFADKLSLDEPVKRRTIQYKIGGFFPTKLGIADGLDQINIRMDSSEGFVTYVSFSNLPKIPKNEVISIKEFEKYLNINRLNHQTYFNKYGVAPEDII